jgi:hypothetical protein
MLQASQSPPVQRDVLLISGAECFTADRVEVGVVVASYNELVPVRQCRIEVERSLEFCRRAMVRYVAGVDKDVAIWNRARIEGVSV